MNRTQTGPWLEKVARAGYLTKGVLYFMVGALAVMTAVGFGGQVTDSKGAVKVLAQQPFGSVLLWLTAIGLFGYAIWCLAQSLLDPEGKGTDAKGIAVRVARFFSAGAHASFGVAVVQMAMGKGGGSSSSNSWLDKVLASDGGTYLVAAAGLVAIGVGLFQMYRGYKVKFKKRLKTHEMSSEERTWATRAGRLGLAARGIVFVMVGIGLIRIGFGQGGKQDASLEGALHNLSQHSYGTIYLGAVAFGLACYGILQVVYARYRRLPS